MIHRFTYALIFLFLLAAAARAQDKWQIEVYGGDYHLHGFDTEVTYGARAGVRLSDHFGLEGSVGTFSIKFDPIKVNATLTDLSLKAYVNSSGKAQFFLFGGPGWAFLNAKASGTTFAREDSFTAHIGAGVDLKLTDHLYVRPDVRGRWFKKNDTNSLDTEASVAIGYSF